MGNNVFFLCVVTKYKKTVKYVEIRSSDLI